MLTATKTRHPAHMPLVDLPPSAPTKEISFPLSVKGKTTRQSSVINSSYKSMILNLLPTLTSESHFSIKVPGGRINKHDNSIPVGLKDISSSADLIVRVRENLLDSFLQLGHRTVSIGQQQLVVGSPVITDIEPQTELKSYCFTINRIQEREDMEAYLERRLAGMSAKFAVGDRKIVKVKESVKIVGFTVCMWDLPADESVLIQSIVDSSFGGKRHYGCSFYS